MKDVGDFAARVAALEAAFVSDRGLEGRSVLLLDDLLQSGARRVSTTLRQVLA